jgi:YidC/Oxa1 family membrane protein insertase
MDKKTIIGIVLIVLITLLMPFYQRWIGGEQKPPADSLLTRDSTRGLQSPVPDSLVIVEPETESIPIEPEEVIKSSDLQIKEAESVKTIQIENEVLTTVWSTAGGANPLSWELKNYQHYSGRPIDLIADNSLVVNFLNVDGKEFNLNDYTLFADYSDGQKVVLDASQPQYEVKFYLPVKNGRVIKSLRFYHDRYSFDVVVSFEDLQSDIINRRYFIGWKNGLKSTEKNISDDLSYSRAYTYMAEELINLDASDKYGEKDFNGRVDWAAVRTKYFLISLIPADAGRTNGVSIGGIKTQINGHQDKQYSFIIDSQYQPVPVHTDTFKVFLGPLDYYILKDYGADLQTLVMNKDWYERLFRPISLVIIPAFKFLYRFIPNYGVVIIVFSILIKLLLHPLTKKSYQSMSEMQFLQPKMNELREKYKNEPQRMNSELMKLYKEHGVNPLGGCLPMLLQMPVLFALFIVFRSTIQLRHQPFVLWMNDLSAPDALPLGITLPLIGNTLSVLPVLMGVTMIWQSKVSMTDPKQKFMIYFMPIFMIFIFYSLPSGLNLYYAVFNVLSMAQTYMIKKKMHPGEPQTATAAIGNKSSSESNKKKK